MDGTGRATLSARVGLTTASRHAAYLGCVTAARDAGEETITSEVISRRTGVNATQIRRDLLMFGRIGKRGVGFSADRLEAVLREAMVGDHAMHVLVCGGGLAWSETDVGKGLVRSDPIGYRFLRLGFTNLTLVPWPPVAGDGSQVGSIDAGVVAPLVVPERAQAAVDYLVGLRARVILNMTAAICEAPERVRLVSFRPEVELLGQLCVP